MKILSFFKFVKSITAAGTLAFFAVVSLAVLGLAGTGKISKSQSVHRSRMSAETPVDRNVVVNLIKKSKEAGQRADFPGTDDGLLRFAYVEPEIRPLKPGESAKEMMEAYWDANEEEWAANNIFKDFFVSKGYAEVRAPKTSGKYTESRQLAFSRAMLDAKADMVKILANRLSSNIESRLSTFGGNALDDDTSISKDEKAILESLEARLKAQGVDLEALKAEGGNAYADALEEAKKLLNSTEFKKQCTASALQAISGVQAYQVFVAEPEEGESSIAVIAVWTPELEEAARMISGKSSGTPQMFVPAEIPIKQQVKEMPMEELYLQFGVHKVVDSAGQVALISYAQAKSRSGKLRDERVAWQKAEVTAAAQIREFAGEIICLEESLASSETTAEYADGKRIYESEENYNAFIKSAAAKAECPGIERIYNWHYKDPYSGEMICGVVSLWHPAQKQIAESLKK